MNVNKKPKLDCERLHEDDHALFEAIGEQQWEESRELLKRSDALRMVQYRSNFCYNTLIWACFNNAPLDIVETIYGIDSKILMRQDHNGETALFWSCENASGNVVDFLLTSDPSTAAVANTHGEIPLHNIVTYRRSPSMIRRFLMFNPASVYATDRYCYTPIEIFFYEWKRNLELVYPHLERLPNGSELDGGISGRVLFKDTFLLLLKAFVRNTVDKSSCCDDWFPTHEAIQLTQISIPSIFLFTLFDQTISANCVKPDMKGNFPLHILCARSPWFNDFDMTSLETSTS